MRQLAKSDYPLNQAGGNPFLKKRTINLQVKIYKAEAIRVLPGACGRLEFFFDFAQVERAGAL